MLLGLSLRTLLTIAATIFFLSLERIAPGRRLPPVRGWYARAIEMNLVQLLLTLGLNRVWNSLLAGPSLPLWDRMFGTYRDTNDLPKPAAFPGTTSAISSKI